MDLPSLLRNTLTAQHLPPPSAHLLATLSATGSPTPPLASLFATARARLLACDLTTGTLIDRSQLAFFPPEVLSRGTSAAAREIALGQDICVQVVDMEDLSSSRWEQIEELEAVERGERTRGREVIRVTAAAGEDEDASNDDALGRSSARGPGRNATHRLVLQDGRGARVYAVELERMPGVGVGTTSIGCKMVVRAGCVVARGTLLLTPGTCMLLGGKIEAWHEAWARGRMARLMEAVGGREDGASSTSRG